MKKYYMMGAREIQKSLQSVNMENFGIFFFQRMTCSRHGNILVPQWETCWPID